MSAPPSRPVVLVTGGAKRVGRAISLAFARAGHDVVVHYDTSDADAAATVQDAIGVGASAVALQADLCAAGAARRLAGDALAAFGRVDVVVNNASVFHATPLSSTADADVDRTAQRFFDLHVLAPLALTHALLDELRGRRGAVVNLGDAAGPRPRFAAYAASKAALASMTRTLAQELAPDVRVNMVAPGAILPPSGAPTTASADVARIVGRVPAGRLGTVEEVADAVLFLATGPAFVTGQVLGVDGGQYA